MKLIRPSEAAKIAGVHPDTIRRWSDAGRLTAYRPGAQRRVDEDEVRTLVGVAAKGPRLEGLYVRVSGSTGQETSLVSQETQLRDTASGPIVKVYKDKSSGLNENRPGLTKLLRDVQSGKINVVRVTHVDRLARFGADWLRQLIEAQGGTLEVLHATSNSSPMEELLADFTSLVTSFSGRLYGMRSRENRSRLLDDAKARVIAP